MKPKQLGLAGLACALAGGALAQQSDPVSIPAQPVERGANYCLWQGQTAVTNDDGSVTLHPNAYTELATGLNYLDSATGQWIPAVEEIDLLNNGGAIASQAQAQVRFPADIYEGDVVITLPDGGGVGGGILNMHPAGLAYFDGVKSVLIATLTNSVGVIVSNTVLFKDCLAGPAGPPALDFTATLRYTFTRAGLEADVIFPPQQTLDPPDAYGLVDSNSSLLVLTAFTNAPAPAIATRQVTRAQITADDDSVDWPTMSLGQGRSFVIGAEGSSIPSSKTYQTLGAGQYLVESTPYALIHQLYQTLEKPHASLGVKKHLHLASAGLPEPPRRTRQPGKPSARITRLAQSFVPSGLALDYILINHSMTNYTFSSEQTYFISAPVYLYNSATFEAAVIKYTNNASITLAGFSFDLIDSASSYAPTLFLSRDDNSAGSAISGSTGTPTNYFANPALASEAPFALSHFRIACAKQAINVLEGEDTFSDGQIVNCQNGIALQNATVYLGNMLFGNVQYSLNNLADASVVVQNATFDGATNSPAAPFSVLGPYNVETTNCVFANMTELVGALGGPGGTLNGDFNGFYACNGYRFGNDPVPASLPPFQQAGAGFYYLTNGCPFRGAGTPNIDPALLTDLAPRTTTAPVIYTNTAFASGAIFAPVAGRISRATPDLGYGYDSLDYLCSGISGTNLFLTNGASMGFFGSAGIVAGSSTISFTSQGMAQAMNHLCWYPSVQEQPVKFNNVATPTSPFFGVGDLSPQDISLDFTEVTVQGGQQNFFDSCSVANVPVVTIQNSQMSDVNLVVGSVNEIVPDPGAFFTLFNNVFTRSTIQLWSGEYPGTGNYNPLGIASHNNLFWGSVVQLIEVTNSDGWTVKDNIFANCTNYFYSSGTLQLAASDNAYFMTPTNVFPDGHPLVISNLAFDVGPFSQWYSDSNALHLISVTLIDAGSRTAAAAGLTNFTLFTNLNGSLAQIGDSGVVDVGAHFQAVDSNGFPVGCQSITNTNTCLIAPFVVILAPYIFGLTNVNGANIIATNAQVTLQAGLAAAIIAQCDGSFTSTNFAVPGTLLSNWNIVTWAGVSQTNLNTLAWTLAVTNGGFGTNRYYVEYYDPSPCGGVLTNITTNTFFIANWITALTNSNDGLGSGDLFGPGIDSSPALSPDGSTVYIENTGDMVYALNVTNGAIRSAKSIGTFGGEITPSPTVAPIGTVFVGSTDGFIDAFSASLVLNWSNALGSFVGDVGVYGTPALTPNGTLYVPTDEGTDGTGTFESGFWSFRATATTGTNNWKFTPQDLNSDNNGDVDSSPAIGPDGTIYIHSEGSRLYALATNGNVKWFLPVGAETEPDSSPAIGADGTIYVGSDSPYFYAVNPDGSIKWTFHTLEQLDAGSNTSVIFSSPAVGSDGAVYFGIAANYHVRYAKLTPMTNFLGILYAVTNGMQEWAYTNFNGEIASSPAIASDGTIYIGAQKYVNLGTTNFATNGALLAIANGNLKWSIQFPAEVVSSPVITSNGTIIIGCEDGNIYAIPSSASLSSTAPWPMFQHDAQHTGCAPTNSITATNSIAFPSDGTCSPGAPNQTQFSFSIVGPKNSKWSVYSAATLQGLASSPTLLGTTTNLGAEGRGFFTDSAVGGANSKFYYLASNGFHSRVIGYINFTLEANSNLIADPFIQVDDGDFAATGEAFSPVNSIGTLFQPSVDTPTVPAGTVMTEITSEGVITNIFLGNNWIPNGDISMVPGVGVFAWNPVGASVQCVEGITRPSITNVIAANTTSYLASALPISGGLTTSLGFTNLSYNDKVQLWDTSAQAYVTYIWTNAWSNAEPNIGLCQGFLFTSANSHIWIQTNSP